MDIDIFFDNSLKSLQASNRAYLQELVNLKNKAKDNGSKELPTVPLKNIHENIKQVLTELNNGISLIKDLAKSIPPTIQWVPEVDGPVKMSWETGVTPWSLVLRYANTTTDVNTINELIRLKWTNNELEPKQVPVVGSYVAVCNKKRAYRGFILAVAKKLEVLNVDDGGEYIEDFESCYNLIEDFCTAHANIIYCSVGKENFEDLWTTQYSKEFVRLLKYSELKVTILDRCDDTPPTFVVNLYAFREDNECDISVNEWVSEKYQELVTSHPERDVNPKVQDVKPNISNLDINVQNLNNIGELNSASPCHTLLSDVLNEKINTPNATILNESIEEQKRFLKLFQRCELGEQPSQIVSSVPFVNENTFKFESVVNAPEFLPVKKQIRNDSENFFMNGTFEPAVMPGNYEPQDENRICAFYAQNKYCWKANCSKAHEYVTRGTWTKDKEELYTETFSHITLPRIGEELPIKATHVMTGNSFFAHLPAMYSDTKDGETLEQLVAFLNDQRGQQKMTFLSSPPCFGQFLIAFSSIKQKFLRAAVFDLLDEDLFQVFFVDYGMSEDVTGKDCRNMLPEFNHLPSQAIFCTLSKIFPLKCDVRLGAAYLESLILDKSIMVKVIDSDSNDNKLELIAHVDGVDINEMMVKKGYCSMSP